MVSNTAQGMSRRGRTVPQGFTSVKLLDCKREVLKSSLKESSDIFLRLYIYIIYVYMSRDTYLGN